MLTKTIMRYHRIPTQVVKIKKMNHTSVGNDVEQLELSNVAEENVKVVQSLWRIALQLKGKPTSPIQSSHSISQCLPKTRENIMSIQRLSHDNLEQLHF